MSDYEGAANHVGQRSNELAEIVTVVTTIVENVASVVSELAGVVVALAAQANRPDLVQQVFDALEPVRKQST